MKKALTVLTHQRPEYLRETLEALTRCHGINEWDIQIYMDDPDSLTSTLVNFACQVGKWKKFSIRLPRAEEPSYDRISKATREVFQRAFDSGADFVAHLEEDCVPSSDFLEYMSAMNKNYWLTDVYSVSAWWGAPKEWGSNPPDDVRYKVEVEPVPELGIATWGIGTWMYRWPDVLSRWDTHHWDRNLTSPTLPTVHPLVSRIKNIGRIGTQPADEHDWRNNEQTPSFVADMPSGRWLTRW